jgi:hypothetical protein
MGNIADKAVPSAVTSKCYHSGLRAFVPAVFLHSYFAPAPSLRKWGAADSPHSFLDDTPTSKQSPRAQNDGQSKLGPDRPIYCNSVASAAVSQRSATRRRPRRALRSHAPKSVTVLTPDEGSGGVAVPPSERAWKVWAKLEDSASKYRRASSPAPTRSSN